MIHRDQCGLYLGSTFHGGGANNSGRVRIGINVDYVLGWLRQEENQYLSYTLDEVRRFPERVQRLMGYEVGAYALGYIDGGRSPMELLYPARRDADVRTGLIAPALHTENSTSTGRWSLS